MIKKTVSLLADPSWFLTIKQWWLLAVMVIVLLLAEYVGLLAPIRSLTEKTWQHIVLPVNDVTLSLWQPVTLLRDQQRAGQTTVELQGKYNQALVRITQLEALESENQSLKQLVASQSGQTPRMILGVPIMAYGRPLIAAGSDQGIVSGMSVLVGQALVGTVTDVSKNQSVVSLLTQENSPKVLVKTETGVTGIVSGDGKRVIMSEIPIDSKVEIGQRVITHGQVGIQPNILIGTISDVKAEASASVQTAVVTQLVSFYESSLVEIE